MPEVVLKPGHVQPIWLGHPWVYAQAVDRVEGGATAGDQVTVTDPRGNTLGTGWYSPQSAIVVRIASRSPRVKMDGTWLRRGVARAFEMRREMGLPTTTTNGFRLVNSEGDYLPGLVVDLFNDVAVIQLTTIGMHTHRSAVVDAIRSVVDVSAIIDRTPVRYSKLEGFQPKPGVVWGDKEAAALAFHERGIRYEIPWDLTQKTGFYFDQRPLRARVEQLAQGRDVLDAFCFVGSFAMAAARGGARSVLAVDENLLALQTGARCAVINELQDRIEFVRQSVRNLVHQKELAHRFDMIILDPPSMAPTPKALARSKQAFRHLVAGACRLLRPGGLIVLSACSAAITLEMLTRCCAAGCTDAGYSATVLERWFQGSDHPCVAAFSEGLYLKSIIVRCETP